jgi:hypothetical protein
MGLNFWCWLKGHRVNPWIAFAALLDPDTKAIEPVCSRCARPLGAFRFQ